MRPRARDGVRIILLQVRSHLVSLRQEREWFRERCGVPEQQFGVINLVDEPRISWRDVQDADTVMIGGAGAYTAYEDHDFTAPLEEVVNRLLDEDRPLFGSCWGHQFLARILGGTVGPDHERSEVGSYDIHLTEAGRDDPLFPGLPATFVAQLGHNDRIIDLPTRMVELARSAACPYQAVRVLGKPAYGTQFHSEMTHFQLRERLEVYRDEYMPDPEEFARLSERLRPSPDVDGLLGRFLDLYT